MRHFLVSIPILLCALAVGAQPGPRPEQGDQPRTPRDQWRSELRDVLRQPRSADVGTPSTGAQAASPPPPSRHLTAQERHELREQLRREQLASRKGR